MKRILTWLAIIACIYGAFAFVELNANAAQWSPSMRYVLVMFSAVAIFIHEMILKDKT